MKMKEKMKYMKSNFKVIEKQYRDIIHQYQVVYCYLDTKKRERCMEDLKAEALHLNEYIGKYISIHVKDLARQNACGFLNVLYEDVNYDTSLSEFADVVKGKQMVVSDKEYCSIKEKLMASYTLIVSYFRVRKVTKVFLKLYDMQMKLLELIKMID